MTETIDGVVYTIDEETGEMTAEVPAFAVKDAESAEWVLERVQTLEAQDAALRARQEAILANIATERSRIDARKKGLLFRFEGQLAEFARENLPKGKKSWVCPYGTLGFRTTRGSTKVLDKDLAVEWAQANAPDAVKVETSVLVSKLPETDLPPCFEVVAPEERFYIDSGVK